MTTFFNTKHLGTGGVVCGHDGNWITRFTYFENGGNALLAELCAIQLGIELVMISTLQTSFVKVTV